MSAIPAGAGQLLGKRLGKFEIVALLALGGTAEIYLARIGGAAGFEKYVVVKCLHDHLADDAEFVKMFLDEARLAAHLDHSNIVQTMELGQYENRYYMVMEFLAGLSLAMIVRRAGERLPLARVPVPLVLNILAQAAAGLHYAHEKTMNGRALNIVHRDISPQNLVISFEGVVKLVDFGIAKAEMRETRTRSGTIKGKFAYMSPEQCVANNVDRRTDVFALGVIGHELLTGRRLFKRTSPYETYQAVMECDVKPPSTTESGGDPAIDHVIMRALTKDKADRYPTAEAFGDALLGYLHHRGIGSGPGDVARFFEAHFGQELDEHSTRMRELVSGRDGSANTGVHAGVSWGEDDPDDELKRERAAQSARRRWSTIGEHDVGTPVDGGPDELFRAAPGSLSGLLDDFDGGSRVEDDDELLAERTRIESNPLERVNELERLAAMRPAQPSGSGQMPASGPLTGPVRLPTPPPTLPPSSMPAMPPSGRFPDLANLPTMISESEQPVGAPPPVSAFAPAPASGPQSAPAASIFAKPGGGAASAPPAANAYAGSQTANAPTLVPGTVTAPSIFAKPAAKPGAQPSGFQPSGATPGGGRPRVTTPSGGANVPPAARVFASAPGANAATLVPGTVAPPSADAFATAPTTVDASSLPAQHQQHQMNTQITPLPVDLPLGPGPGVAPAYARPDLDSGPLGAPAPPVQHAMTGYPVMNADLRAQIATGATVFPSDPRPPGLAGKPGAAPHPMPHADPNSPRDGYPIDPQRAANLMSPVGQYYPEYVDWEAAAAAPARAVPTWLLAILFIAALGVALALTVAVAKIVS